MCVARGKNRPLGLVKQVAGTLLDNCTIQNAHCTIQKRPADGYSRLLPP